MKTYVITYVIQRYKGRVVERVALPFPEKPVLKKNDKLLRVLIPEDCPYCRPDGRSKASYYNGQKRIR
jgi:hypothetical protein